MAAVMISDLSDETHRALQARAAEHGRSTEAEIREILTSAVEPETPVRMGDALAAIGRKLGLTDEDFEIMEQARDRTPSEPMTFE